MTQRTQEQLDDLIEETIDAMDIADDANNNDEYIRLEELLAELCAEEMLLP